MEFIQAKAALCRLLCVNIDLYPLEELKQLVNKRKLAWHPDKNREKDNPNKFSEQFMELMDAWKIFKGEECSSGSFGSDEPDLHCYESSFSSESEPEDDLKWRKWERANRCNEEKKKKEKEKRQERESTPEYNDSPFDEEFFIPSPKKKFAIPDDMRTYFRSASNRRAGKFFSVFSLENNFEAGMKLYRRLQEFCNYFGIYLMRTNKDLLCCLINLTNDYRLADIKKECRKVNLAPSESFYCTKVAKCIEFCKERYGQPKAEPCRYKGPETTPDGSKKMNYKLLTDFAMANEISDVYELMYEYSHLSSGCDRSPAKITNEHENDHIEHRDNAKIFDHLSDKKRVAKNAVDCVFAKLYMQIKRETNLQYLNRICKELGNDIQDTYDYKKVGEAYYYCKYIIKDFKKIGQAVLNSFIYGKPRERYIIFKGDFKCGKTSLAFAFLKLFGGTSINVNCDKGRLPFYLGQAIGMRYILFDDVKGRSFGTENLSSGLGFANLDDLRDYIDGHVEVQLEKKNQQPISQIFPCGLITCNDYFIPKSLLERTVGPFEFKRSPLWRFHNHEIITKEIIFIGLVLSNLLPVEPHIFEFLYTQNAKFEAEHLLSMCGCKTRLRKVSGL